MAAYRLEIPSSGGTYTAATLNSDGECSLSRMETDDDAGFRAIVSDGHWSFENNNIVFTASTNTSSSSREGYMKVDYTIGGVDCYKYIHLVQKAPPTPKAIMTLSNGTTATAYCDGNDQLTKANITDVCDKSKVVAIDIKNCVKSTDDYLLSDFQNITSITMSNSSITTIGKSIHNEVSTNHTLKSITFSSNLSEIGESCFWGCSLITSLTFPNSLQTLKDSCFRECDGITAVTIPNSVRIIGFDAFHLCYGLREVTIGTGWTGTTGIGRSFQGCSNLKKVTINATTPPDIADVFYFEGCHSDLKIYVPASSVNAYKNATNWSSYSSRIRAIGS